MSIRKNLTKILVLSLFIFSIVFTPNNTRAATKYKAGDLLKIRGVKGAAVYQVGSDGKKYVYPDQKTFNTWHDDFSDVKEVDLEELDDINDGGTVTFQPGTKLITHRNTAKVYAVGENGDLTYIPSEDTARKFYGSEWYKLVLDIDPGIFAVSYKIKQGVLADDNLPEGSLIEEEDTGDHYLIEGGQRRKMTEEALKLRNIIRKNIIKLKKLSSIYDDGEIVDIDDDIEDFEIGQGNEKITICHKPDLVNRTIRVSVRALETHLAHGDIKGECIGDSLYNEDDEDIEDNIDNEDGDSTILPDITISNIVLEPDQFTVNETIDIYVYIKNSGTVALTDTTGILDNSISFEDFETTLLPGHTPDISENNPLEPGETTLITWTGHFTSVGGDKRLYIILDNSNELEESDETNNTYTEYANVL